MTLTRSACLIELPTAWLPTHAKLVAPAGTIMPEIDCRYADDAKIAEAVEQVAKQTMPRGVRFAAARTEANQGKPDRTHTVFAQFVRQMEDRNLRVDGVYLDNENCRDEMDATYLRSQCGILSAVSDREFNFNHAASVHSTQTIPLKAWWGDGYWSTAGTPCIEGYLTRGISPTIWAAFVRTLNDYRSAVLADGACVLVLPVVAAQWDADPKHGEFEEARYTKKADFMDPALARLYTRKLIIHARLSSKGPILVTWAAYMTAPPTPSYEAEHLSMAQTIRQALADADAYAGQLKRRLLNPWRPPVAIAEGADRVVTRGYVTRREEMEQPS